MRRNPVFSHDELICKLITQPDDLELCLLKSATEDAKRMVSEEQSIRDALSEKVCVLGIVQHTIAKHDIYTYMYMYTVYVYSCIHEYMYIHVVHIHVHVHVELIVHAAW